MAVARNDRKAAIRSLVRANSIRTQGDLLEMLRLEGYEATQATISRDMSDLGLIKDGGIYIIPEDLRLRKIARTQITETRRAGNQVLILTEPGAAQATAAALDAAALEGVLGSIAGDDTILVITADEEAGAGFQELVEQLIG